MKLYKKYKKISPYKKSMLWWNGQEQPVREKGGKSDKEWTFSEGT